MSGMLLEKTSARIVTLADQCVQCATCLPVCSTYALDADETESPRGRTAVVQYRLPVACRRLAGDTIPLPTMLPRVVLAQPLDLSNPTETASP